MYLSKDTRTSISVDPHSLSHPSSDSLGSRSPDPSPSRPPSSTRSIDSYRNSIASLTYLFEQDPATLEADIVQVYGRTGLVDERDSEDETGDHEVPSVEGESMFGEYKFTSSGLVGSQFSKDGSSGVVGRMTEGERERSSLASISTYHTTSSRIPLSPVPYSPDLQEDAIANPMTGVSNSGAFKLSRGTSMQGSRERTARKAQKLASFFGTTRGEVSFFCFSFEDT